MSEPEKLGDVIGRVIDDLEDRCPDCPELPEIPKHVRDELDRSPGEVMERLLRLLHKPQS